MPRLQDLERFKRDLFELAHESEVLARWGEKAEISQETADERPEPSSEPAEVVEEGLPPDFAALLGDLPLDSDESKGGGLEDGELAALLGAGGGGEEPESGFEPGSGPSPESAEAPFDFGMLEGAEAPETDLSEPHAESVESQSREVEAFDLSDLFGPQTSGGEAEPPAEALSEETAEAPQAARAEEARERIEEGPSEPPPAPDFPFDFSAFASSATEGEPLAEGEAASGTPGELGMMTEMEDIPESFFEPSVPTPGEESHAELPLEGEAESVLPPPEGQDFGFDLGALEFGEKVPGESASEGGYALPGGEIFDFGEAFGSIAGIGEKAPASAGPEAEKRAPGRAGAPGFDEASPAASSEGPGAAPSAEEEIESFSFEEEAAPVAKLGEIPKLDAGLGLDIGLDHEIADLAEEVSSAESLDRDWGGGFPEMGTGAPRQAPPRPGAPEAWGEEKFRAISLDDAQVDRLQDSLLSFPLNLRVAIEDIIANAKGTAAQQSRIIWALVEGKTAEELALLAGRVLKHPIHIPKGYEKRTGAALEAEKGTLRYIFVHTILPVLRAALLVAGAVAALGWLGWRFVYRPLAANALYRSGYARIAEDRFAEAESTFAKATAMREFVAWYYRYAEAYAAKRQYILAERRYRELLDRHPGEKRGALDWARLEASQLKYEAAIEVLQKRILERDFFNEDALLLQGDVNLAWGEEEPARYEEARRSFAGLIQRYGQKDLYLERMLLYFMRVDVEKEVLALKARFLAYRDNPLSPATMAELGGYLFDKRKLDDIRLILASAAEREPGIPEAHYHLARYFRATGMPVEERKALDKAIEAYADQPSLSSRRTGMQAESLVWRGRYRLETKAWLGAEQDFAQAVSIYEKALELRRLKKDPRFGAAYAGLAEVAYWQRDDRASALALYKKAADHGYDSPDIRYKRGYISYRAGDFRDSLEQFYRAGLDGPESPYLLYAFGNALYERQDYFAAQASYSRTVEAMKRELEQIERPSPQAKASEGEIVELLMRAHNNLGATLFRVGSRIGDARMRSDAMAAFAESMRLYDSLARDQATMKKPDSKNLAYLNMDYVLHPKRDIDLAIYAEIERDMRFPRR